MPFIRFAAAVHALPKTSAGCYAVAALLLVFLLLFEGLHTHILANNVVIISTEKVTSYTSSFKIVILLPLHTNNDYIHNMMLSLCQVLS